MIILGDLHLGIKKFNREFCDNQIKYIKNIIDISAEDDKVIWQLGDIFDNRQNSDIFFLEQVESLFKYLKEKDVKLYTLVGNHDIYWRENRETSLVSLFESKFPDNFIVFKERDTFSYYDKEIYIVPWMVKGENLNTSELKGKDAVFGHFEINGFEVVKGHLDEKSSLSESFFKKAKCPCFSGHYHIRNINQYVKYLGTPYQLNWNDFNEKKGYYKLDENLELEFFENLTSPKHIKILYNDTAKEPIELHGLEKNVFCNLDNFEEMIPKLKGHFLKFFVNKALDTKYEEFLFLLKEHNLYPEVINNQKISELIETSYTEEVEIKPSIDMILDFIKDNRPDTLEILSEMLSEVQSQEK